MYRASSRPRCMVRPRIQTSAAVRHITKSRSASASSAAPISQTERFPAYTSFLQGLKTKKPSNDKPLVRQSFREIDPAKIKPMQKDEMLTWTSQYDSVSRSPFARDIIHLQSLLDALLTSKNYERADKILRAIHPLSENISEFMFALNKYLEAWAAEETTLSRDLEKYVLSFQGKDSSIAPNDRTYAILLSKAIRSNNEEEYDQLIKRITTSHKLARGVLSNIEVLGVDNLTKIFDHRYINEKHIPNDLLPLFEQMKKRPEDITDDENYFEGSKVEIPSLTKEAEEIRSVESFGLKIVRHTLLGLKTRAENEGPLIDELIENLEKDIKDHVINSLGDSNKRDYFALYRLLKTDEDRKKFDAALDLFNQTRQKTVELRGADSAKEKWKHDYEEMTKRGGMHFDKSLNVRLYEWFQQLLPYVREEVNQCHKILNGEIDLSNCKPEDRGIVKDRMFYAPYLTLVPPEKMCAVTILELLRLNSTGGVVDGMRTARALISVGKAIELEYKSQKLMDSQEKAVSKKTRSAREWSKIFRFIKPRNKDEVLFNEWDNSLHAKIGSVLTWLLIRVAKVPVKGTDPVTGKTVTGSQAAFFHTYQYVHGQKLGVLKLHKNIVKQISSDIDGNLIQPHFLPMLTPPRPWTSYNEGGYLYSQTTLIRTKDSPETIAYLKAASSRGDLNKVFDGLNVLGETAWTVNRKVLEVMIQYWNTGKEFLDIPPIVDEPKLPDPIPSDAEPDVRRDYQRKVKQALNQDAAYRSQRCDTNYKLEIARAFIGERMFFPHNIDFRGRAYPISPHFNHLGNDLTRSLFLFWDGKPLGEEGLRWLKVHLANLYGIDKVPLEKRVEFVDQNMDNIIKSAENPYDEDGWWTKGEKPWQVLAVCFELKEAFKLDNPTKFVSHIPVHQDGSCNGLQHYAALGGDTEGARQVNLVPADRPQDVYSYVAGLVQKRVDQEAAAGNKYALFLQDKITRKVVKQTVMTNVYGVTFVGARDQIKKQIARYFPKDGEEKASDYALFLTTHVFASVRELFKGAHEIQDWLGEAARIISKSVRIDYEETTAANANKPNHLSSVIWTTPLGLPCVQPYRASKKQIISTNLQDVAINDPFGASPVDARKQKTALPPNFVHSLDATHMLMTARACKDENLVFASVHDSYWTHACDIERMSSVLRNQFVELHSNNLVEKVKEEFEARYKGFLQVVSIPRDHELARKVQDVRRRIVTQIHRALTVADEIHLEKRRQELLASNDPKVVADGKQWVTTVSVVEDYDLSKIPQSSSAGLQILVPIKFPPVPKKGDFDVGVVKDSTYFFS